MRAASGPAETAPKPNPLERVKGSVRRLRSRSSVVDHAVRAIDRNSEILGGQEAAAITYFGFLAFFPLLALSFALLGYVSAVYPDVQQAITEAVQDAFPGLLGTGKSQINIQDIIDSKQAVGLLGLVGLLYAGLGWIASLRNALRHAFATRNIEVSFIKKKLVDIGVLILLGVSLLLSVIVTSIATAATTLALDFLGLEDSVSAMVLLKVLSVSLALAADTVLFAILLSRLSGADLTWRRVRTGAFVGACGFEILKLVGTFLIARTTANPVYAAFGVVVGLLVWMNLVAKVTIFAAAWTVTQPFSLEPGDLNVEAAGHSTPVAAMTEPVTVVAPADYEQVPVRVSFRGASAPSGARRRWRSFIAGAITGVGATAALRRLRRDA